jgi:diacylglycerol kinase family enzyme
VKETWSPALQSGILQSLRANGWMPELYLVDGHEVAAAVTRAVESKVGAVMAGGGDGTTRAVASQLIGSDVALGILPFGTLNLAARDLGTPLDPVAAVASLHPGSTRRIDVLSANDELCLCMLVLGFYPVMASQQPEYHGRSWWRKSWRFARSLWTSYLHTPLMEVRLTDPDGDVGTVRTRFLAVVPGEYEDVLGLVPRRESLATGHCTLYTSRHHSRWGVLRACLRYLAGRVRQDPDLEITSVQELTLAIRGQRRVPVAIDGEILTLNVPIALQLRPRALTVLRPATAPAPENGLRSQVVSA